MPRRPLAHFRIIRRVREPAPPHRAGVRLAGHHHQLADLTPIGVRERAVAALHLGVAGQGPGMLSGARVQVGDVDERGEIVRIGGQRVTVRVSCAPLVAAGRHQHAEVAPGLGVLRVERDGALERALGRVLATHACVGEAERAPHLGVSGCAPRELLEHAHGTRRVAQLGEHERVLGRGLGIVRVAVHLLAERARRGIELLLAREQHSDAVAGALERGIGAGGVRVRDDRCRVCVLALQRQAEAELLARPPQPGSERRIHRARAGCRGGSGRRHDELTGRGFVSAAVGGRRAPLLRGAHGGCQDRDAAERQQTRRERETNRHASADTSMLVAACVPERSRAFPSVPTSPGRAGVATVPRSSRERARAGFHPARKGPGRSLPWTHAADRTTATARIESA